MKVAFDEIMATTVKRQHQPQRIIGDLLTAEISEKQARSIKYQFKTGFVCPRERSGKEESPGSGYTYWCIFGITVG